MNKLMVGSIAIAMFLFAGCGAVGEGPPEPNLITSVDAIVGVWHRTSGKASYIGFDEDGNIYFSALLKTVVDGRGTHENKYWFEEEQLIIEGTHHCPDESQLIGMYVVQRLENGNLKFLTIEEDCTTRRILLAGREGTTPSEYEPVP